MLSLSFFTFPSTIVWVDDDLNMLNTASEPFGNNYQSKKFVAPQDAIVFFDNYSPPLCQIPFLQPIMDDEHYGALNHSPVDFNVLSIPALKDYTKRTQEVSILVTDFNMPGMNGVELCQKLEHLPMKKILLTGETDHKLAVSAFNEGIIDKFILKAQSDTDEELKKYIHQMNEQYFVERSRSLLSHLEADRRLATSDPVFIRFFKKWCEENQIKEYYLFDKNGSFLCINTHNEILYFVVYTNDALNYLAKLYESQEISALYEPIATRQKIPFLGTGKEAWQLIQQYGNPNWNDYLYSYEILKGREDYYWTVVKG